jgi:L-threonylcarbamoyladenylate synthase
MRCQVLRVADDQAVALARAAEVLQRGGLVAMPTETVYGLAAHALDGDALARLFAAKGRPAHNPVIVHVADADAARALASDWPDQAQRLAQRFWPGPLSLVVPRRPHIPDAVTAGGPTVALRVPAHPVALALLRTCGLPLAAPSANLSTQLSPTRAEHVLAGLAERIDLLLDAGPTPGGLESTVVDVTTAPPRLLRPGLVTRTEVEAVLGPLAGAVASAGPLRAPGQLPRHYAPRTPLELVNGPAATRVAELAGQRVGVLSIGEAALPAGVTGIALSAEPGGYSAGLYAALHTLDAASLDVIVVELPPPGDDWLAVHDRLCRAAKRD